MSEVSGEVVESSNPGRFSKLLESRHLNLELAVMVPAVHINELLCRLIRPLSILWRLNTAGENLPLHYWL